MVTTAPYGSWRSAVTPELLVSDAVGLGWPGTVGGRPAWVESRPLEGGRQVLVVDGEDVTGPGRSVRTALHEYGGRCWTETAAGIVWSDWEDQRLHLGDEPLTAAPDQPRAVRFADPTATPDGRWLVAARETHTADQVVNDLAVVDLTAPGSERHLTGGHDFAASPRLSPDGRRLAWITWDHPDMPWDHTELWVADFGADGTLGPAAKVAGAPGESVTQPRWSPDGRLHWISDRSGWWNLYAEAGHTPPNGTEAGTALAPKDAEFAAPDWQVGQSNYTFLADGRLVATWQDDHGQRLGFVEGGAVRPVDLPFTSYSGVVADGQKVLAVVGLPSMAPAVVHIDPVTGWVGLLRESRGAVLDSAWLSVPEAVSFPTSGGRTAHAYWYPPANPDFVGPADERPPLVVISHGGPTASTSSVLNYAIQFWTSRGFGLVDVDYGGSTGYGREYRRQLRGQWGVVDVDDCVAAAAWLADRGLVDRNRMVIRGGSAGGYTTLAALAFRDTFAAGASHFGVADLALLAADTHKFESRYLDGLIAPYPDPLYEERAPIHHLDGMDRPVILFQGLEDRIVPPEQASTIAAALTERGVPVAHLTFEGEQHGFRRAETIVRVATAELAFYGRVLGFTPAGESEPFSIANEESL